MILHTYNNCLEHKIHWSEYSNCNKSQSHFDFVYNGIFIENEKLIWEVYFGSFYRRNWIVLNIPSAGEFDKCETLEMCFA